MAIWAEIKKAINSNLDVPLNELLTRQDDYLALGTENVTVLNNPSVVSSASTTGQLIATIAKPSNVQTLNITVTNFSSSSTSTVVKATLYITNSAGVIVQNYEKSGTTPENKTFTISNGQNETYYVYVKTSHDAYGVRYQNVSYQSFKYYKSISNEKYLIDTVKNELINNSGNAVALSQCPRLDRCEFDYFVSGIGYAPSVYVFDGISYVTMIPPYCVMRIKY